MRFFRQIDYPAWGFFAQPIMGTWFYDYCVENGIITDEKKYLEDFQYGYNKLCCTVNVSRFDDVETLNRKIWETRKKINVYYFMRHPVKLAYKVSDYIKRKAEKFLKGMRLKHYEG